jgi:hydrogenase 3 maturation protease
MVARQLSVDDRFNNAPNLLILEGGPAPENQTGRLRAFQPDLVLFIDAAHLEEAPGTIQFIPLESIDGMSASSHSLPLSMLARYIIHEFGCQVQVLGIQPAQNEICSELSSLVRAAMDEIVGVLARFLHDSLAL